MLENVLDVCCCSSSSQEGRGLIAISAWDNKHNILHTKRDTMWFVCQWHYSTQTTVSVCVVCVCVFFNIFNIILKKKCVILFEGRGCTPSWIFYFLFYFILFTRANTYKRLSVYLYPVWHCLQPCCTMMCLSIKKKEEMEADVQLFLFLFCFFPENFYMIY